MFILFVLEILLILLLTAALFGNFQADTNYYAELFPLNHPVFCKLDSERLNNNYLTLRNSLKELLDSGYETGYIIRKPGNILMFYHDSPNEVYGFSNNNSYIKLLKKPNKLLWIKYLKYFSVNR